MKLSVFTTVTDGFARGDNPLPAIRCYQDLCDELVVVDGGKTPTIGSELDDVKVVQSRWPKEFNWRFFSEQFQRGYDACTGDWVIRADLDYIFHEKDFEKIRQAMIDNPNAVGLCFYKYQFILPDRYNIKSRLVVALNKGKYGDRIRLNGGGDECQATLDGIYIDPESVPSADVGIYNYEKILKTKAQIADDVGRMERAWERHYGKTQYRSDGTDERALAVWLEAQRGKFSKPQEWTPLDAHPKYIQDTIKNLKPENFGYNGFGLIQEKVYA